MTKLGQRIRGLFACLALLGLVVAFPAILIAIGLAPWDADLAELRRMLTRPDDGSLAFAAFAAVGWCAWAVVTGSVLLAAVAEVRRLPAPALPGLAMPQQFAAHLVGAAALLFVATPTIVAALPSPPAYSVPAVAPESPTATDIEAVTEASAPRASVESRSTAEKPQTLEYTVARGDSLWRIAERLLGDGARFPELVDLNADVLDGRPDFITPGTVLRVPVVESSESETVVVEPGDTLSEIATEELGDPDRYPEIYGASRQTTQPDGEHLTDPDLIRPGWTLTIPGSSTQPQPDAEAPTDPQDPSQTSPGETPSLPSEMPSEEVEPEEPPAADAEPVSSPNEGSDDMQLPAWVLPGLAGSGLLAGAVLTAVRAHRRTQLRYRRPGQTLAPPPPELINADKTAHVYGASAAVDIEGLDTALNALAAHAEQAGQPIPGLQAIALKNGSATLHLAEPSDLPSPWLGSATEWSGTLGACTNDEDVLPPYPMLVSIGSDADGALWLANLEQFGSVAITGDSGAGLALARHITTELALNPWAVLVQTDAFGLGHELADLDTHRLRTHDVGSDASAIIKDLQATAQRGIDYPDPFQVVVTTDADAAVEIQEAITASTSRLGAAVITFDCPATSGSTTFELASDGTLAIPRLNLTLVASGLSADEAAMCAAIVDVTRITPTVGIPLFSQAADGWRSVADQAGALKTTLTEPRPDGEAGSRSLLPEAAEEYVQSAATTRADVAQLAPLASPEVQSVVAAEDPGLDDDVATWFSPDSPLPRLTLLGPVRVTANGDIKDIVKRRPYFEELVAFLALHPEGVTARVIADAFNLSLSRVRTDIGFVRAWLGDDPRTGELHLPKQANFPPGAQSGYHIDDLLVDADLFRRLRARGQSRGADGMEDLVTALRLVTGRPFDNLRSHGWSWLLDDEPNYSTLSCAIVDTAHVVVLDALQHGETARAREAAETGCKASPYDEVCRLDLAKALEAEGRPEVAEKILDAAVFNRRDDAQPPIDLPRRTKNVAEMNGWGQRRSPNKSNRPAS